MSIPRSGHHTSSGLPTMSQDDAPISTRSLPGSSVAFNPGDQPFIPAQRGAVTDPLSADNVSSMNNLLSALTLPQPEVPKFSGGVTEFRAFITAFMCCVTCGVQS